MNRTRTQEVGEEQRVTPNACVVISIELAEHYSGGTDLVQQAP
jgi:hypothetical protein